MAIFQLIVLYLKALISRTVIKRKQCLLAVFKLLTHTLFILIKFLALKILLRVQLVILQLALVLNRIYLTYRNISLKN